MYMEKAVTSFLFFTIYVKCQELEMQNGTFKYNYNFDNILPINTDAYFDVLYSTDQIQCARECLKRKLCEGFLFNTESTECRFLSCPLHGLKTSAYHTGWNYYGIKNDCDEGWTFYEGHCYLYNETVLDWFTAKTWCEESSSYLVEVDSQEESDWITNKFLKTDVCASIQFCSTWSGGNDIITEGTFIWAQSNTAIVYTNWVPGEPGNGILANCINMRSFGQWNDALCSDQFKFICEKLA